MSSNLVRYNTCETRDDHPDPYVIDPATRKLRLVHEIPIETKNEAYERYMFGNEPVPEIATALGIDARAIALWAKKHGWADARKQISDELVSREDTLYTEMLAKARRETAERHIRIGQSIEQQIEKVVQRFDDNGEVMDSKTLRAVTESLASVAAVTARAAAIAERPSLSLASPDGEGGNKPRVPLIIVNAKAQGVSQKDNIVTIDANEE